MVNDALKSFLIVVSELIHVVNDCLQQLFPVGLPNKFMDQSSSLGKMLGRSRKVVTRNVLLQLS